MEWTPAQMGWDLQLMVLWVVLPPIFGACALLTMVLPRLLHPDESARVGLRTVLQPANKDEPKIVHQQSSSRAA